MYLRRSAFGWTAEAPAKLNLYLGITDRRPDGFHGLETLMVPIRLYDQLNFLLPEHSNRVSLKVVFPSNGNTASSQDVPSNHTNLVVRAVELLKQESGVERGANLRLIKRIPSGAGLGGGSSNAAAALRLANKAWQLNWSAPKLASIAARLGSDVPFFLADSAAICRGRGELVSPLAILPKMSFVVVMPPETLSTADVYRTFADGDRRNEMGNSADAQGLLGAIARGSWNAIKRSIRNDLQIAASLCCHWVGRLSRIFDSLDVVAHQLTGSGSAYFGICRNEAQAQRLASQLRSQEVGQVFATCCCR